MKKEIRAKEPTITLFPYPVYLISCKYKDKSNITPVGWVSPVCNEPPMFGIALRPNRYSYNLIKKSGKFALNIPTKNILEEVDYCGSFGGDEIDKIKNTDLTLVKYSENSVPIIKECPINLECEIKKTTDLGNHTHFIGEVKRILVTDGFDDLSDFFIAIGTNYYGLSGNIGNCQNVYLKKFRG